MADDYPWRDKETLEEMYHGDGMTCEEIGNELGCSNHTVGDWMERLGIEKRSPSKRVAMGKQKGPVGFHLDSRGYEIVQSRYYGENDTTGVHRLVAVAHHGFDAVCDSHVHHKNGVRWDNRPSNMGVLSPGEHATITQNDRWESIDRPWTDESVVRELYEDRGLKRNEVAEVLGCSPETISRWFKRHGIESRYGPTP